MEGAGIVVGGEMVALGDIDIGGDGRKLLGICVRHRSFLSLDVSHVWRGVFCVHARSREGIVVGRGAGLLIRGIIGVWTSLEGSWRLGVGTRELW